MSSPLAGFWAFLATYVAYFLPSILFPMDSRWLASLQKPTWSPPGAIVGLAWMIVYGMIALSVALLHTKVGWRNLGWLWKGSFIVNLLLVFIYFAGQTVSKNLFLSFLNTALIAGTAFLLVFFAWPYYRVSALLFLPYALWSSFATYLAWAIYRLNA
ncbi:tryptophan-rich sensory protein [Heliorestis acidaminivorans]|uniref:Tryptophan-rich sensory protein n=1 Tax=Heliorestis acidaminivorans TaxID=553427 RepID=A0A6I0F3S3_9FIRM|nr:tryptophan-rich sensory protein [Heliorestis acidaminivorans]KAB2953377.1 tryptophan-rich sensory protein [Heliorestis acidaminivorans]